MYIQEVVEAKIIERVTEIKSIFPETEWPRFISMMFGCLIEENFNLVEVAPFCTLLEPFDEFSSTFDFDAACRHCLDENIPALREAVHLFPSTELGKLHEDYKRLNFF